MGLASLRKLKDASQLAEDLRRWGTQAKWCNHRKGIVTFCMCALLNNPGSYCVFFFLHISLNFVCLGPRLCLPASAIWNERNDLMTKNIRWFYTAFERSIGTQCVHMRVGNIVKCWCANGFEWNWLVKV